MSHFIGQSQEDPKGGVGRKEVEAIESRGSTITANPTQAPARWVSPGRPWPLPFDSH